MTIFIIGMPAAGKTFYGRQLAVKLGYDFIDLDQAIETEEEATIPIIFEKYGESGFRQIERRVLKKICALPNTVISTGGGAPCFHGNIAFMNDNGITIWLKTPKLQIIERLQLADNRPLFQQIIEEKAQIADYYDKLYEQRKAFYEQAIYHVVKF